MRVIHLAVVSASQLSGDLEVECINHATSYCTLGGRQSPFSLLLLTVLRDWWGLFFQSVMVARLAVNELDLDRNQVEELHPQNKSRQGMDAAMGHSLGRSYARVPLPR